ncbi:YegP family protein [Maribacter sp. 2308TA10-17]|uniref:YegP family protein n=1 Tax=Maribacter sp. 2308TA10-17 TaxID=3386276 RepID=UPI0039BC77C5
MIEIHKKKEKTYEFILKTENGNTLLNSVGFANKSKAEEAVKNLKNLKTPLISFERKTNHNGEFLFSIKSKFGGLIGSSQPYQSEAGMENGIRNLRNRINSL